MKGQVVTGRRGSTDQFTVRKQLVERLLGLHFLLPARCWTVAFCPCERACPGCSALTGSSCGRVDGCGSASSTVRVRWWMDAFSSCQRARASCSVLVGRPRGRLGGGGSAGRLACIQASTSCSHQQRRRLPGSLNGGGIRCRYFSFVAQVLIVVSALPINAEVSSMWRRRGVPLLGAADFLLIFFTILKALGDRVAFAAHDRAARKFSDGGVEGAG